MRLADSTPSCLGCSCRYEQGRGWRCDGAAIRRMGDQQPQFEVGQGIVVQRNGHIEVLLGLV